MVKLNSVESDSTVVKTYYLEEKGEEDNNHVTPCVNATKIPGSALAHTIKKDICVVYSIQVDK